MYLNVKYAFKNGNGEHTLWKCFSNIFISFQTSVEGGEEGRRGPYRPRLFDGEDPSRSQASPPSWHDDGLSQLPHHKSGEFLTADI